VFISSPVIPFSLNAAENESSMYFLILDPILKTFPLVSSITKSKSSNWLILNIISFEFSFALLKDVDTVSLKLK
jgi:hypothetical protein